MNLDDPAEFERQFQAVYAYAARRVGETLGEEIAAETFARALAARDRYDGREDPLPWLLGIASNLLRRHWRSEKRRLNAYARSFTHEATEDVESAREAIEAVARLPRRQREVVLLHVWADLSYDQIARALDGQAPPGAPLRPAHRPARRGAHPRGPAHPGPADLRGRRRAGEERTIKDGMVRAGAATVAGRRATIVRYSDAPDDFTAIWGTVYARELGVDLAEFKRTLEAIHQVGAEEWLRALPKSAVTPRAQDGTIAAMLKDIPVPPGFKAPTGSDATRDRYQLGAAVAGAVACGWIERWLAGDAKAAAALASARDWPLLHEMDAKGDYPEVVWQYADAVNGKSAVPGGKLGLTVDGTYKDALGC